MVREGLQVCELGRVQRGKFLLRGLGVCAHELQDLRVLGEHHGQGVGQDGERLRRVHRRGRALVRPRHPQRGLGDPLPESQRHSVGLHWRIHVHPQGVAGAAPLRGLRVRHAALGEDVRALCLGIDDEQLFTRAAVPHTHRVHANVRSHLRGQPVPGPEDGAREQPRGPHVGAELPAERGRQQLESVDLLISQALADVDRLQDVLVDAVRQARRHRVLSQEPTQGRHGRHLLLPHHLLLHEPRRQAGDQHGGDHEANDEATHREGSLHGVGGGDGHRA
mmetsp:Transcript_93841/g.287121  ORF Transcript_93841/g.287121 Transcript_93841/m.287121 type:complete len:278 (+) Transcript_93841:2442-3275(+)